MEQIDIDKTPKREDNFGTEKLPEPPTSISIDGEISHDAQELISDDEKKLVAENRDRINLEIARADLREGGERAMTPEEVLLELGKYSKQYMSAPTEALGEGNFADADRKLTIENGCVVLVRHANDFEHLVKSGAEATPEQMRDASLYNAGSSESGALPTSADVGNVQYAYLRYPIYGKFMIPVSDFLKFGKERKIIIGNIGEAEIVISGDVGMKYLVEVGEK